MAVRPIPDGYHTVTPYLTVQGVPKLIDFLKQAFEAQEIERMTQPDGTIGHAKDEELAAVYERLQQKGIQCYAEPQVMSLEGYGSIRALVFEDPDGVMIELIQLPSADEIRRVREGYRAERQQPTA